MLYAPSIDALPDLLRGSPCDWSMSEKLDGVRAEWDGRTLASRTGKLILAPTWFTAGLPAMPLTGELWVGRGQFETVCSVVKSTANETAWRKLRFMAFDSAGSDLVGFAKLVAGYRCIDLDRIWRFYESVLAMGGEGIVVVDRDGTRAKLKPIVDTDARVVDYVRSGSRLVSLIVQTQTGVTLRLGSGLTALDRERPPRTGSIVRFAHDGLTAKGTPRHARFLGRRFEESFVM